MRTVTYKKTLYWLPRILSILFIIFISLFALDVFGEPNWLLALVMHLIPTYIMIAVTYFSWKNPKIGGIIFIALGISFLIFTHFQGAILAFPTLLMGVLFILSRSYSI